MDNSITALNQVNLIFLVGFMGLLPFMFTIVTSYCKIIVVTYLVRNALGVQQVPPTMVLTGLAIILTMFIMAPVAMATYDLLEVAPPLENYSIQNIINLVTNISGPMHEFLLSNCDQRVLNAFINASNRIWPEQMQGMVDHDSLIYVIPSFVITELTKAFQIGFLLYLPFIAIDLIISNILLAMGMMMVSPMTISLPFKLMLFVTLDGWLKLSEGLMYSYTYS
ncbi:MAG: type III secretion system export apparatus subunit SctR [Succinatimonas sp.]|nr:type III secretion system export apparatus subunit SctR [Succinatimonas sp.]